MELGVKLRRGDCETFNPQVSQSTARPLIIARVGRPLRSQNFRNGRRHKASQSPSISPKRKAAAKLPEPVKSGQRITVFGME